MTTTRHVTLLAALLALATLGAPAASADQELCAETVCVRTTNAEYGTGDCENGPDHATVRRASVTHQDGATTRTVYAENQCWAYRWGEYWERGSVLTVGYYAMNEETYEGGAAGVSWYGFDWSGGRECNTIVYSYGVSPLPDGAERFDCATGSHPGLLVPALP